VELDGHFIMSEQALPQTLQSLAIMEDGIVLGDEHRVIRGRGDNLLTLRELL